MEAYRVRKNFQWDGWIFAPKGPSGECKCPCVQEDIGCVGLVGQDCMCKDTACHCDCGIPSESYGGDVWFVDPGNPRKETMLEHRFATYDAGLPSVDTLLKDEEYKRLLDPDSHKPVKAAA